MYDAEAVRDECAVVADQFGQLPWPERSLSASSLLRFARIEPDVLQQQDIALGQSLGPRQRIGSDDVPCMGALAQFITQRRGDGRQRILGVRRFPSAPRPMYGKPPS